MALHANISMTLGRLYEARAHAYEAGQLAAGEADDQALVEAAMIEAEVDLLADNLQAAVGAFNHAQALAQEHEATVADALTSVGLGRVLLRRELWEEAAVAFTEALPRLRAAEDVAAQALAQISLGEARRNLADEAGARTAFTEAGRLARESGAPLLEAEALGGEARALLDGPELEAAEGRYRQALALVEGVGDAISDMGDRASFFDGYASLYAEAIYAAARARASDATNTITASLHKRATRTGCDDVAHRLQEYARAIPTSGRDLEPDERERNEQIVELLTAARKTLGR